VEVVARVTDAQFYSEPVPSLAMVRITIGSSVNPVVRRVSRDSLAVSLHQIKVAIDAQKVAKTQ